LSIARRLRKWLLWAATLALVVFATVLLVYAFQARVRLPDLKAWHTIRLKEEFVAGKSGIDTFEDYLRLEDRLFAELRARILDDPQAADPFLLSRYHPGSVPARLALDTPHNRSYELTPPATPRGAVLLMHGLSDSPYSVRALAEAFAAQGYYVLVLRLPGHGTTPSALREVSWKDWYAALTLAAKHAAAKAGEGRPFVMGGHSTGAALAALYAVRSLEDPALPKPKRIYLISAAIGISEFAALTNVVGRLQIFPYFEKSAWLDVLPEYDPYKYNSFPLNAANQIYHLTRVLAAELAEAKEKNKLTEMPRVLVFQSLVDSTVLSVEVVQGLLAQLPNAGNELVIFDVNRHQALAGVIAPTQVAALERIRNATHLPYRVTLIANQNAESLDVASYVREAGTSEARMTPLPLAWPEGVFSLGHVALPFPPDDPVYGLTPDPKAALRYPLGAFAGRGESGALIVPLGMFARLRCNPFFDVIRSKVAETCREDAPAAME